VPSPFVVHRHAVIQPGDCPVWCHRVRDQLHLMEARGVRVQPSMSPVSLLPRQNAGRARHTFQPPMTCYCKLLARVERARVLQWRRGSLLDPVISAKRRHGGPSVLYVGDMPSSSQYQVIVLNAPRFQAGEETLDERHEYHPGQKASFCRVNGVCWLRPLLGVSCNVRNHLALANEKHNRTFNICHNNYVVLVAVSPVAG
jgi:hypothetical protein